MNGIRLMLVLMLMAGACRGSSKAVPGDGGPADARPGDDGPADDHGSTDGAATDTGGPDTGAGDAHDARSPQPGDSCHAQSDCGPFPSLLYCLPPGESGGCGACIQIPNPCTADTDCAAMGTGYICDSPWCGCGRKTCIGGCTAGSCPENQTCAANNRCAPSACTPGDNTCSAGFACDSGGHCARKTCKTDADCPTACVNGGCFSGAGVCTVPLS